MHTIILVHLDIEDCKETKHLQPIINSDELRATHA